MTLGTCGTTIIALIIMALPAWGQQQYLLYSPQPVTSSQPPPVEDGILVQEIVIQRGDTLSALSRKFSGRGMYFPQILLFNSIKNPNLIYTGNTLKVPVTHKESSVSDRKKTRSSSGKQKISESKTASIPKSGDHARKPAPQTDTTPATELSLGDLKTAGAEKSRAGRSKKKTAGRTKKHQPTTDAASEPVSPKSGITPVPEVDATDGQKLFEAAAKAYRRDDCKTALELLDLYLADNSNSPLAADANLYKADCYLKLSAQ